MEHMTITIDGPAGAGKSTVAKALAERLGIIHLDTGAIYRTIGLCMIREGVAFDDTDALSAALEKVNIEVRFEGMTQKMLLNGENVTAEIRTMGASYAASMVALSPDVRRLATLIARDIARTHALVMDGRDAGTVILPSAAKKFYLTASLEVRARRRHLELAKRGDNVSFEATLKDVAFRDSNDSGRSADPLRPANDACIVDTTDMNFGQVVEALVQIINQEHK